MPTAPKQWIQDSLALLERLQDEQRGMQEALDDIDRRRNELAAQVASVAAEQHALEDETGQFAFSREAFAQRKLEIEARHLELGERLRQITVEREELTLLEQSLEREMAALETAQGDLPTLIEASRKQRASLDGEMRLVDQARDDVLEEVQRLQDEISGLTRALQAVAAVDAPVHVVEAKPEPVVSRVVESPEEPPEESTAFPVDDVVRAVDSVMVQADAPGAPEAFADDAEETVVRNVPRPLLAPPPAVGDVSKKLESLVVTGAGAVVEGVSCADEGIDDPVLLTRPPMTRTSEEQPTDAGQQMVAGEVLVRRLEQNGHEPRASNGLAAGWDHLLEDLSTPTAVQESAAAEPAMAAESGARELAEVRRVLEQLQPDPTPRAVKRDLRGAVLKPLPRPQSRTSSGI